MNEKIIELDPKQVEYQFHRLGMPTYGELVELYKSAKEKLSLYEDMSGFQWHDAEKEKPISGERVLVKDKNGGVSYAWWESSALDFYWNKRVPGRNSKTEDAAAFFLKLANADIKCIAIENSVGIMSTVYRKPDQIIQPWQFGHPESKATCLWLKGLPKLDPTNILQKPSCGYWDNQTKSHQNKIGPSVNRWKDRSRTYAGIADAMADQWGKVLED